MSKRNKQLPKISTDGVWSRNLRSRGCLDSDSDESSSGSPPVSRIPAAQSPLDKPMSADAKLMQDLDISVRHDEARYKPNPWTIAKVNAAARLRSPSENLATARASSFPSQRKQEKDIKMQPRGGPHPLSSRLLAQSYHIHTSTSPAQTTNPPPATAPIGDPAEEPKRIDQNIMFQTSADRHSPVVLSLRSPPPNEHVLGCLAPSSPAHFPRHSQSSTLMENMSPLVLDPVGTMRKSPLGPSDDAYM